MTPARDVCVFSVSTRLLSLAKNRVITSASFYPKRVAISAPVAKNSPSATRLRGGERRARAAIYFLVVLRR